MTHKRIKINAPLTCEVLDKITIKFETLHQFSVVKSCHVSKNNQLEVVLCILCKEVVFTLNVSISCEVFVFFVVPTRINAPLLYEVQH